MPQNYFLPVDFMINVLNQSSQKNCAKYGKYTDLKTYFSEKNIWKE